jgi:hypothetical protein
VVARVIVVDAVVVNISRSGAVADFNISLGSLPPATELTVAINVVGVARGVVRVEPVQLTWVAQTRQAQAVWVTIADGGWEKVGGKK